MKAAARSLRRRAAAETRRWRDDHGDAEGRDTDVRTRDSGDAIETEAIPPPPPAAALVCRRIYRDTTHDETTRNDGSESDGLLSPTYGQRPPDAGELVKFDTITIGPSSVTADTLFGPCSDYCDVLCSEMLNGGVKDVCSVFSCNEEDNSCSAVTKCPPSLPDNPDGYCNPETGECGGEEIGLVSSGPINRPDSGVDLISTATTASSCNQDFFLPIDMAKEKRKLKRARKKWRLASAKRGYSYQVSEKSSPFYRSTRKKAKIVAVFREISRIFKKVGEGPYYNFAISYNRKLGYPKTVQLGYISSEGPRCVDIDLRIKRLRFSRPVDPCDPINQRTFDVEEALADLNANQLKFNDLQDYTYTISRNCFCPEEFRGPFVVTVRDGKFSSATYEGTTQPVDHSIPTIAELFDLINDACTTPTAGLSVVYNDEMGYPESLYIDQNECIADEETSYMVSGLEKLTDTGLLGDCDKLKYNTEEAQANLASNKLKFGDLNNYDFTYSISRIFMPPDQKEPYFVSVRNGIITSATNKNTNSPVDPEQYSIQTISDLYNIIDEAIARPASGLEVTYNSKGYPERTYIDAIGCLYDDEVTYHASDLVIASGPDEEGTPPDDCMDPKPTFNVTEALSVLATNQKKFNEVQDYDYTFSQICFCPPDNRRGPYRVSVRGGNVTAITEIDTEESLDPKSSQIRTIAQIFDDIKEASTTPTFQLEVTYNAEKGYPEKTLVDKYECLNHEEKSYTVSNLVDRTPQIGGPVVPGGPGGPGLTFTSPLDEAKKNQVKWDTFLASTGSKSYIFTYREDSLFEDDQIITVLARSSPRSSVSPRAAGCSSR